MADRHDREITDGSISALPSSPDVAAVALSISLVAGRESGSVLVTGRTRVDDPQADDLHAIGSIPNLWLVAQSPPAIRYTAAGP